MGKAEWRLGKSEIAGQVLHTLYIGVVTKAPVTEHRTGIQPRYHAIAILTPFMPFYTASCTRRIRHDDLLTCRTMVLIERWVDASIHVIAIHASQSNTNTFRLCLVAGLG